MIRPLIRNNSWLIVRDLSDDKYLFDDSYWVRSLDSYLGNIK